MTLYSQQHTADSTRIYIRTPYICVCEYMESHTTDTNLSRFLVPAQFTLFCAIIATVQGKDTPKTPISCYITEKCNFF